MYKIDRHTDVSNFNVPYTYDHYTDLEDDTQLLSYKNTEVTVYMMPNEKVDIKETEYAINISNGEKGIVLAEESVTPYLMQLNKVQREYDIEELITIYSEEIKPQLGETEKPKKAKIKR